MRILIVEDEEDIARSIAAAVERHGYIADIAHDGEEAHFLGFTEDYDAVILDLGLPRRDGLSVLRDWRQEARLFPVLVLTARDSWQDKVEGIDAGADDYLAKPFEMPELLARLRAIIRRHRGLGSARLSFGPLEVDTRHAQALLSGQPIPLTPLEFRLLNYLAHKQGEPAARSELLEHIYGTEAERDLNALDALITRLRRKIGSGIIRNRRGHGYYLASVDDEAPASTPPATRATRKGTHEA